MSDELGFDELNNILGSVEIGAELAAPSSGVPTEHGEENRKKKKKLKRSHKDKKRHRHEEDQRVRTKYVLDAAESTSGDESFIEDGEEEEEVIPMYQPEERERFLFHKGDELLTDEQLGQQYEERARMMAEQRKQATKRSRLDPSGGGALISRQGMTSLRYTSEMLPQPSDPKVFAVKCKPRMARILVARILNKCYAYRIGKNLERKGDLGIISVFSLDHVKEYIYLEAHRQLFVTNALEGLVGVFRYNISQVQPGELMQMMERKQANESVHLGSLVRLRQRPYRGDLAEVVSVHPDGRHITVKVVPREDFVGKSYSKVTTILPQRFFAPEQALQAVERGDHYQWGELKFDREGYLLKVVSVRAVTHGAQLRQTPDAQELAQFYNNSREKVKVAIARYSAEGSRLQQVIRIGDTVRVITGQLKDTVGTVTNLMTNSGLAELSCTVPNQAAPVLLRVELSDCTKNFPEGTHVVVEEGEYRGMSGTVVKSYGEVVVLFCDRDDITPEITVKANECYQSKLVSTSIGPEGSTSVRNLYELVRLTDSRTVGCVVLFHRDSVDVLTEQNKCRTVSHAQIKAVGRGGKKALDAYGNVLTRDVEVTIRNTDLTPFQLGGQSGKIEQVFNDVVFVAVRSRKVNAGLVALPASCVALTGGRKAALSTSTTAMAPRRNVLPAPQRRPHNAEQAEYPVDLRSVGWEPSSEYLEESVPH